MAVQIIYRIVSYRIISCVMHAVSATTCSRRLQSSKWLPTTTSSICRGWRERRQQLRPALSLPCCLAAERHLRASASPVTRRLSVRHRQSSHDHRPTYNTPVWLWHRRTSCISRYATKVFFIILLHFMHRLISQCRPRLRISYYASTCLSLLYDALHNRFGQL